MPGGRGPSMTSPKGQSRRRIWKDSACFSQNDKETERSQAVWRDGGKRVPGIWESYCWCSGDKWSSLCLSPRVRSQPLCYPLITNTPTCCPCLLLIFTHHPITSPWSSTPAVPWSSEHYTEAFNPLQTPTQYFTIILFSTREATLNNYRQYFKHQISSSSRSAEDLQQIDLQLKSTVIFSLWVMFKSCLLRESQALSTGFVPRLAIIGVF